MFSRKLTVVLITVVAAACGGGDKPAANAAANSNGEPAAQTPEQYRAQREKYADSVLNKARGAKEIVDKMGKDYLVGSVMLRDSIAALSNKSQCFAQGRKTDPYLAGTVSYFVFMSVVGSNAVRVQSSEWTSAAGNIVDACLNDAAKAWKFEPAFGKPGANITQVQFK